MGMMYLSPGECGGECSAAVVNVFKSELGLRNPLCEACGREESSKHSLKSRRGSLYPESSPG